jgi:hypothetical protein
MLLQITQSQIGDFGGELQKFQERFKELGPGAVGTDLDRGMTMSTKVQIHTFIFMYTNYIVIMYKFRSK